MLNAKTNVNKANTTIYPMQDLGYADHGWLQAKHHFSFSSYYNPKRIVFGDLLVINDDKIQPNKGFATHSHDNMEIITYVRTGAITHKDSMGNVGRTEAGDVQVMSAGSGVSHSEYNHEPIETTLYQIWIKPNVQNVAPRWEAKQFPKNHTDKLILLASGMNEHANQNAAKIYADAAIYGGKLDKDSQIIHPIKHQAYILLAQGEIELNGYNMKAGDGAEVMGEDSLTIKILENAEILVIDVPA